MDDVDVQFQEKEEKEKETSKPLEDGELSDDEPTAAAASSTLEEGEIDAPATQSEGGENGESSGDAKVRTLATPFLYAATSSLHGHRTHA